MGSTSGDGIPGCASANVDRVRRVAASRVHGVLVDVHLECLADVAHVLGAAGDHHVATLDGLVVALRGGLGDRKDGDRKESESNDSLHGEHGDCGEMTLSENAASVGAEV